MQLIRIPSVSAQTNRPVIEYVEERFHAVQWQTRRHPYNDANGVEKINLIAAPPGQSLDEKHSEMAFVCHTDTVPYAADWQEALIPDEREGFIYGCGACDVKAFLACLLTAACSLEPASITSLRIVLTADEEIGCIGAQHFLASGLLHAEHVVVGEPTCLKPARAGKGYCLASITVSGQEAHSAHPDQGASAILGAAHLLIALEELATSLTEEQNPLFDPGYTTFNTGTIRGGTAKNIIPGECSFLLEWRPIPHPSSVQIASRIQQIIDRQQLLHPRLRYSFDIIRQQPGFETASDGALVRTLEALSGRSSSSIPFGSEASLFANVCHNVVVFGPGDMQTAHSSRECVPIDQLHRAVHCLRALMLTNQ